MELGWGSSLVQEPTSMLIVREGFHLLDSTPILVGAGQFTDRQTNPELAHSPMGIAAEAAKAALASLASEDSIHREGLPKTREGLRQPRA